MDLATLAAGGRANFHTHSTWCDGKATPREMAQAALRRGLRRLGFSSHAMLPADELDWCLTREKLPRYIADIRSLACEFAGSLEIFCGVEADYVPGGSVPDRAVFARHALPEAPPDYIIGSIHFVRAPDGALVEVDLSPQALADGIERHFGGDAAGFVRAYFKQQRDMVSSFDFDVVGHADLVRKFNARHPYFDENAPWYREELERTADAIAASGKIVEINTGAIARGWMDDAYPSAAFRAMLAARGVRFILSSDAHSADAVDCAFQRFSP